MTCWLRVDEFRKEIIRVTLLELIKINQKTPYKWVDIFTTLSACVVTVCSQLANPGLTDWKPNTNLMTLNLLCILKWSSLGG